MGVAAAVVVISAAVLIVGPVWFFFGPRRASIARLEGGGSGCGGSGSSSAPVPGAERARWTGNPPPEGSSPTMSDGADRLPWQAARVLGTSVDS